MQFDKDLCLILIITWTVELFRLGFCAAILQCNVQRMCI